MDKPINNHMSSDVIAVQQVVEIPLILDTISMMTGLSFLCVARVKPSSLTVCAVLDNASKGLKTGDELTINFAIYECLSSIKEVIAVDDFAKDHECSTLPLPGVSEFESLISSPIILENGKFFGNLYGVGSAATSLANNTLTGSIAMLTKIISSRLSDHLIRNGVKFLTCDSRHPVNIIPPIFKGASNHVKASLPTVIQKIDANHAVINSVWARMDFDGKFDLCLQGNIKVALMHVVAGLHDMYPGRVIVADIDPTVMLRCDIGKLEQLLSNLLNNALIYGHPNYVVRVNAECQDRFFRLTVIYTHPNLDTPFSQPLIPSSPYLARESVEADFGLSLFIIFEIAKAHAGKVDIEHDNNETKYTFTMRASDFIDRRTYSQKITYLHERRLPN